MLCYAMLCYTILYSTPPDPAQLARAPDPKPTLKYRGRYIGAQASEVGLKRSFALAFLGAFGLRHKGSWVQH